MLGCKSFAWDCTYMNLITFCVVVFLPSWYPCNFLLILKWMIFMYLHSRAGLLYLGSWLCVFLTCILNINSVYWIITWIFSSTVEKTSWKAYHCCREYIQTPTLYFLSVWLPPYHIKVYDSLIVNPFPWWRIQKRLLKKQIKPDWPLYSPSIAKNSFGRKERYNGNRF